MFTKVGVILKPSSPELKTLYSKVKSIFNREGFEVVLESASADMISEPNGIDFDDMAQFADLLISIGGDGTLISVARKSFKFNKPIVGIHAGNLGFLVNFLPEDIYNLVKELKVGNYKIEERIMLEVFLNSQPISLFAFNEIVLSRDNIAKMNFVKTFVNDKLFNSYYADGLIISTPTGSTAYNLSAGGPIVHPCLDGFILTPICPHSLTQKPIVIPNNLDLSITVDRNSVLVLDGQESYNFNPEDKLTIKKAKETVKLLFKKDRDYFQTLKEKLKWGN